MQSIFIFQVTVPKLLRTLLFPPITVLSYQYVIFFLQKKNFGEIDKTKQSNTEKVKQRK